MKARFTGLPFRVSFGLLLCLESLLRAQPVMPKSWEQSKDAPFALQQNSPDVFRIDVSNREQVRAFYNTVFQASEDVPMEWTGSYTTGDPGSTSLAYRQAVILRVNYFRAMAGVPANIVLNEVYSDKAERAALMMSANDALNHFPPSDWTFFTEEGAEAASSSDLFLGVVGPDAVSGYIRDDGANNYSAGHRRWILYPPTRQMGTGDVAGDGSRRPANALWVFDNLFGTRPVTREEFVAWPPPGYVPYRLIFPRWSFSYPNADFSSAAVTLTRNSSDVPVTLETVMDGPGDNTLVWLPTDQSSTAPVSDSTTHVTIENVQINGVVRQFSYDVISFDPATPGPDTALPVVSGPSSLTAGTLNSFAVQPIPLSSAYQFRLESRVPLNSVEGAESGLVNFQALTSLSYQPVAQDVRAAGQASFHLACPDFKDQFLVWNRNVLVGANTQLRFYSRLGWATPTQAAEVQVSTDEGSSWQTIYRQTGNLSASENTFVIRTVSLSSYTGRSIRLRFAYLWEGESAFTKTSSGYGWYLDEISLANAEELTPVAVGDVSPGLSFTVTPSAAGGYALQARAKVFADYFLDWSTALRVQAVEGPVRPRFRGLARVGGTGLQLVIETINGKTYKLESSPDFIQWSLMDRFVATGQISQVADPAGITGPQRFYRVLAE